MLILGLLLVLLSAASVAVLVGYNNSGGPEQMIVLFGRDWISVTPFEAFVAGLALALAFCLGLWLLMAGGRRSRAARADYRNARRAARENARERDDLAKQLERERATTVTEPEPVRETVVPETTARRHRDDEVAAGTTVTQEPAPRRGLSGIGRHFRRPDRTDEPAADQPTTK
jgi:uncharacterized membrane protein